MKKTLPAVAIAAGLVGGGALGAAVFAPALAGADEEAPAVETIQATETPAGPEAAHVGWVDEALAELVAEGTLTQAEADAVADALAEARPDRFHLRGHHARALALDEAAEILGLDVGDVRAMLSEGMSLADIAAEQGVDPQAVVDALVAEVAERLDVAVADGRLTREEADERLAGATDRITDMVNGELVPPAPGEGFRRGPRGVDGTGPGEGPGPDGDVEGTADA